MDVTVKGDDVARGDAVDRGGVENPITPAGCGGVQVGCGGDIGGRGGVATSKGRGGVVTAPNDVTLAGDARSVTALCDVTGKTGGKAADGGTEGGGWLYPVLVRVALGLATAEYGRVDTTLGEVETPGGGN